MPTPLGIATTNHVYNQTRSKSLITLNNRLVLGISYDHLQQQQTTQNANMMQQVEEDRVYISENMSHSDEVLHVFAMDNLDWKKTTLEGGSFNATTAIIENAEQDESSDHSRQIECVSLCTAPSKRRKTLSNVPAAAIPTCHISASDRQKYRSLSSIKAVGSLETPSDNTAVEMLLVWHLARQVRTPQLLDMLYEGEACLPGFSAFCVRLLPHHKASKIRYLPLIPKSPTDPAMLKEEMTWLVKTSRALGDKWNVITGNQAT